ncbi:unnamed protein product [Caenorhabditis sp. 36 PRJEB53466]|nr:unnamed protein product [Caenorhabditis sp. 36 PRJEB53466]
MSGFPLSACTTNGNPRLFGSIFGPNTFKLLKLPDVALMSCLRMFSFQEISAFALCSEKCNELARSAARKPYEFLAHFVRECRVAANYLETEKEMENDDENEADINQVNCLLMSKRNHGIIGWENRGAKLLETVDRLAKVFKTPIHYITINLEYFGDLLPSLFAWIDSQEVKLENWKVATKCISISFKMKPKIGNFRPSLKLRSDQVRIDHSYWVSVENLFEMDCAFINLQRSSLNEGHLNTFLKSWLDGSNHRLESLMVIRKRRFILNAIILGLNVTRIAYRYHRKYYLAGGYQNVFGGWNLQRKDGAILTITTFSVDNDYFCSCILLPESVPSTCFVIRSELLVEFN